MVSRLTSVLLLVLLLWVGALTGCLVEQRGTAARRLSTNDMGGACAGISKAGCCASKGTLRYCSGGKAVTQSCQGGLQCGWSASFGLYTCGNGSGADPGGVYAWACPTPDAGPDGATVDAVPDGAAADAATAMPDMGGCGALTYAGCCKGQVLHFCAAGKALSLDCASNPKCGWSTSAGFYTCGTTGKADPKGKVPRTCPLSVDAGAMDSGGGLDAATPDQGGADLNNADTGGAPDISWANEGFTIAPDTTPHVDAPAATDRGPVEQGAGLDFTGFEGGAGDLGGASLEDGGCQVVGGRGSRPLLLMFGFLLLLLRRR